jgi:hypothetical protein
MVCRWRPSAPRSIILWAQDGSTFSIVLSGTAGNSMEREAFVEMLGADAAELALRRGPTLASARLQMARLIDLLLNRLDDWRCPGLMALFVAA